MAIALNSALGATTRFSNVTSVTQAFNNVAGTFLVVGLAHTSATDVVTSVTYGGVAMTRAVGFNDSAGGEYHYLYYLKNPNTGSNNVVISFSSTVTCDVGAASYTGVNSTDVSVTNTTNTTTITETLTTLTDNSWMVAWSGFQRGSTASTNSTYRSGVSGGGNLYDNNAAITPTGSYSMSQTFNASATSLGGIAMTLTPSVATTSTNPAFLLNFV